VLKLAPLPVDGLPPVADHVKLYGAVPPVPVAVKVTAVPTFPVVGPPIVTASASGEIATVADAWALFVLLSVAETVIVKVPLTEYVVENVAPVPLDGDPPVAVQANV